MKALRPRAIGNATDLENDDVLDLGSDPAFLALPDPGAPATAPGWRAASAAPVEATPPTDLAPAQSAATLPSVSAAFPDGVSSGDVTQHSAVIWTRAIELGDVTFQISTDPSFHHVHSEHALVTDPLLPVKVEFDHLRSDETYYYRVVDASGDVLQGSFHTAAELGVHRGFHFGVVADEHPDVTPLVAAKNAPAAGLDLVVKLGDTIYASFPLSSPPTTFTLDEFRLKHDAAYSTHLGFDFLADLQAVTPVLSMIDDAEVRNNFAGGAPPASD